MLMRVPDELESSVTDGKEKKIQLAVTSLYYIPKQVTLGKR